MSYEYNNETYDRDAFFSYLMANMFAMGVEPDTPKDDAWDNLENVVSFKSEEEFRALFEEFWAKKSGVTVEPNVPKSKPMDSAKAEELMTKTRASATDVDYTKEMNYDRIHNDLNAAISPKLREHHRSFMAYPAHERNTYLIALLKHYILMIPDAFNPTELAAIEKMNKTNDPKFYERMEPCVSTSTTRLLNYAKLQGTRIQALGGRKYYTSSLRGMDVATYPKHVAIGSLQAATHLKAQVIERFKADQVTAWRADLQKREDRFLNLVGGAEVVVDDADKVVEYKHVLPLVAGKYKFRMRSRVIEKNGVPMKVPEGIYTGLTLAPYGQYGNGTPVEIKPETFPQGLTMGHPSTMGILAVVTSTKEGRGILTELEKRHGSAYGVVDVRPIEREFAIQGRLLETGKIGMAYDLKKHLKNFAAVEGELKTFILQDSGVSDTISSLLAYQGNTAYTLISTINKYATGKVIVYAAAEYLPALRYKKPIKFDKDGFVDEWQWSTPQIIAHDRHKTPNKRGVPVQPQWTDDLLPFGAIQQAPPRAYTIPDGSSKNMNADRVSLIEFMQGRGERSGVTLIDLYTPGVFGVMTKKVEVSKRSAASFAFGSNVSACSIPEFDISAVDVFACYVPALSSFAFARKYGTWYNFRFVVPDLPFCFGVYVIGVKGGTIDPAINTANMTIAIRSAKKKLQLFTNLYSGKYPTEWFVDRHLHNKSKWGTHDVFRPVVDWGSVYESPGRVMQQMEVADLDIDMEGNYNVADTEHGDFRDCFFDEESLVDPSKFEGAEGGYIPLDVAKKWVTLPKGDQVQITMDKAKLYTDQGYLVYINDIPYLTLPDDKAPSTDYAAV